MIKSIKKAKLPKLLKETRGHSLTPVAGDALLHEAKVLSEGVIQPNVGGKVVYSGSTMLSINLNRFYRQFQSADERDKLLQHLKNSLFFRLGVLRIARREAECRCANGLLGEIRTELEFTIEQDTLLVDIDVLGDVEAKTAGDFGHGEV